MLRPAIPLSARAPNEATMPGFGERGGAAQKVSPPAFRTPTDVAGIARPSGGAAAPEAGAASNLPESGDTVMAARVAVAKALAGLRAAEEQLQRASELQSGEGQAEAKILAERANEHIKAAEAALAAAEADVEAKIEVAEWERAAELEQQQRDDALRRSKAEAQAERAQRAVQQAAADAASKAASEAEAQQAREEAIQRSKREAESQRAEKIAAEEAAQAKREAEEAKAL